MMKSFMNKNMEGKKGLSQMCSGSEMSKCCYNMKTSLWHFSQATKTNMIQWLNANTVDPKYG